MWNHRQHYQPSQSWNSITKAMEELSEGYSFVIGSGVTSFWYGVWTKLGKMCDSVPFVNIADTEICIKDVCENGNWEMNRLYTQMPSQLLSDVTSVCVHLHFDEGKPDAWTWRSSPNGAYSAKAGYDWLLERDSSWDTSLQWD